MLRLVGKDPFSRVSLGYQCHNDRHTCTVHVQYLVVCTNVHTSVNCWQFVVSLCLTFTSPAHTYIHVHVYPPHICHTLQLIHLLMHAHTSLRLMHVLIPPPPPYSLDTVAHSSPPSPSSPFHTHTHSHTCALFNISEHPRWYPVYIHTYMCVLIHVL